MFCSKCGQQMEAGLQFCTSCGTPTGAAAGVTTTAPPGDTRYQYLSPYWRFVFQKFDQRPAQMQTHWNWPAFFFGPFWYLVKGLAAKAALYFVVSIATAGVAWLFLAIYAGLYGPWDYYLKETQGKQLW